MGVAYPGVASLKYAEPLMLEEVGDRFPQLRILIAHLGYPWVEQTAILLGKYPHMYAEVSGLADRPWHLYQALVTCMEHGVLDKLLFGSNYPFGRAERTIEAIYQVNLLVQETNLPKIPREMLRAIVERDALTLLERFATMSARVLGATFKRKATYRALHELMHLGEYAKSMSTTSDLDEVAATTASILEKAFDFELGGIVVTGWGRDQAAHNRPTI